MPLTDEQAAEIRAALKRCRPETIDAALRFRTSGDAAEVPLIVYGIVDRHLAPEVSQKLDLHAVDEGTRLVEDLGIDSLTMLEIVLSIEETMAIRIENEELKDLRTLGDVKSFIGRKLATDAGTGAAPAPKLRHYDRPDLMAILPHGPPFLFLDEAEIEEDTVRAKYTVKGDEDFLAGHFKGNPVFPASIVFEAVGQAACLWVLECAPARLGLTLPNNEVLFASMENAHFHRRARPGDTLEFEAKLHQLHAPLAVFDGMVRLRGERLAQIERLVLAFGQDIVQRLDQQEEPAGRTQGEPAAARGVGSPAKEKASATAVNAAATPAPAAPPRRRAPAVAKKKAAATKPAAAAPAASGRNGTQPVTATPRRASSAGGRRAKSATS